MVPAELLPVLAQMSAWGLKYLPVSEELGIRAKLLEQGGPAMWNAFMTELREDHLDSSMHGSRAPRLNSVRTQLQAAYEEVAAKRTTIANVKKAI